MTAGKSKAAPLSQPVSQGQEFVITRIFDAPRELVWKAWTDPNHIAQWWRPNGFSTTTDTMDVRPGGVWRFVMHGPDGLQKQNRLS